LISNRSSVLNRKRLLFVVNDLSFFYSHRLPIAIAAQREGFDVHVAYGALGDSVQDEDALVQEKLTPHFVAIQRGGMNPIADFCSILELSKLFENLQPSVVHLITIKPYLYGGIAARLVGIPAVVSAVAGLGSMFVRHDLFSRWIRIMLYPLYLIAFGHRNQRVIVQNSDDEERLVHWGVLHSKRVQLLRGSGVDLSHFTELEEPPGLPVICFAARLLRDKGVFQFLEAGRILKDRDVQARFLLAGDPDLKNPTSVTEQDLSELRHEGVVELIGYQKDIASLYARSHIVCFPSFYGEGLPKTLVEAAAAGRAVVTSDHPGCRDAIIPNETGLLVPVREAESLANALQWLIEHPKKRAEMGRAGRNLAEREFGIEKIVDAHLKIYQELLDAC
jgi:glycosyltransferase involved in cell wall biosynthesis